MASRESPETKEVQELTKRIERLNAELKEAGILFENGYYTSTQFTKAEKDLSEEIKRATRELERHNAESTKLEKSFEGLTGSVIDVGQSLQGALLAGEPVQALGSLASGAARVASQMGVSAVQIGLVGMAVSALTQAGAYLWRNWDEIRLLWGDLRVGEFTSEITKLGREVEELGKKTEKTAAEVHQLAEARRKLAEHEQGQEARQRASEVRTGGQTDRGASLRAEIVQAVGGGLGLEEAMGEVQRAIFNQFVDQSSDLADLTRQADELHAKRAEVEAGLKDPTSGYFGEYAIVNQITNKLDRIEHQKNLRRGALGEDADAAMNLLFERAFAGRDEDIGKLDRWFQKIGRDDLSRIAGQWTSDASLARDAQRDQRDLADAMLAEHRDQAAKLAADLRDQFDVAMVSDRTADPDRVREGLEAGGLDAASAAQFAATVAEQLERSHKERSEALARQQSISLEEARRRLEKEARDRLTAEERRVEAENKQLQEKADDEQLARRAEIETALEGAEQTRAAAERAIAEFNASQFRSPAHARRANLQLRDEMTRMATRELIDQGMDPGQAADFASHAPDVYKQLFEERTRAAGARGFRGEAGQFRVWQQILDDQAAIAAERDEGQTLQEQMLRNQHETSRIMNQLSRENHRLLRFATSIGQQLNQTGRSAQNRGR